MNAPSREAHWTTLYRFARVIAVPGPPAPDRDVPAGSRATAIIPAVSAPSPENGTVLLEFAGGLPEAAIDKIRITCAAKVKEEVLIEASLPGSGERVGLFDVRYAYAGQMFEIAAAPEQAAAIFREGIALRMRRGTAPVWIVREGGEGCEVFAPHVLVAGGGANKRELFIRHLRSNACYHRSGWMVGCVLDGLYDLYRHTGDRAHLLAAERHLRQFLADRGGVEEHSGPRVVGGNIVADVTEGTLPYAVLAKLSPDHPAIAELIRYWHRYRRADGSVYDRETDTITGEGVYTAGYPMAAAAAALRRDDLAEMALRQLLVRKERLAAGDGVYLRANAQGVRTYRNWARALAWYLLGAVKILAELQQWHARKPGVLYEAGAAEFVRAAAVAGAMQRPDGLWSAFADDPATGAETGGSAGIAAALAIGARAGLLEPVYAQQAEHTWRALDGYVTSDGFLTGVSQTNQGGEQLQRSGYRVMFQMGMGLMAQLGAALGKGG